MTLFDVLDVLENGTDSGPKRKIGMIERTKKSKNMTIKVLVAESYNYDISEDIWLIVHVGVTR
ncbi:MAG: hypothetical protein FJ149_07895 [Euryarchaeota archaeon]|nr:hypothetical protein [Euryarchaeota archaeon]